MPSSYEDEEGIYKCTRHPSKRRRTGVCPACLREALLTLCPDCAHRRPCPCRCRPSISTRMSDLIDNEPSFRRSRSISVPFLWSTSREEADGGKGLRISRTASFSLLRLLLFKKSTKSSSSSSIVMMRSSSMTSESTGERRKATARGRGWNFPSPINVLRQSKISKLLFVQQGSPLCSRG